MIRLRGIVTLVTSLVLCLAAPAFGQGFTDYRQAAQDQYKGGQGQNPTSAGGQGQQGATAASTTTPPAGDTQQPAADDDEGPDTRAANAPGGEAAGPVAVSKPQAAGPVKGQLPFTGSDLTTLVLIALLLVALGALAAVAERTSRRRRGGGTPA